jgi:hypothetical protein
MWIPKYRRGRGDDSSDVDFIDEGNEQQRHGLYRQSNEGTTTTIVASHNEVATDVTSDSGVESVVHNS